jgi:hypothetical protein
MVDLTYRAELRELNDLNFARFEAKMGERLATLRGEFESKLTEGLSRLRDDLSDRIRDTKTSLLGWMFGFWIGTAGLILSSRLVQ